MLDKLFQIMRFQVLSGALKSGTSEKLSAAYVYAWDEGVYPIRHCSSGFHQPFKDDFEISEEMMLDLLNRLDEAWGLGRGKGLTFYELEELYETRMGTGPWDRMKLVFAVRYLFLCGDCFDAEFFEGLLRDSQSPAEANSFMRPFDPKLDIYLN